MAINLFTFFIQRNLYIMTLIVYVKFATLIAFITLLN